MKTTFSLKFLTLLAFASLFIISCSKDDDDDDDANNNTVVYDGTSYTMVDGLVSDYGSYDPIDLGTASHYNIDFAIVDAVLVQVTEGDYTYWNPGENTTIWAYAELFSSGTASFQTGTFVFIDYDTATAESIEGKIFFTDVEVGVISGTSELEFEATAGTVTVSGSGTNYTISFDITLENGKKLTGGYSGVFKFEDETSMLKKK